MLLARTKSPGFGGVVARRLAAVLRSRSCEAGAPSLAIGTIEASETLSRPTRRVSVGTTELWDFLVPSDNPRYGLSILVR
jgi:hypothetical protein